MFSQTAWAPGGNKPGSAVLEERFQKRSAAGFNLADGNSNWKLTVFWFCPGQSIVITYLGLGNDPVSAWGPVNRQWTGPDTSKCYPASSTLQKVGIKTPGQVPTTLWKHSITFPFSIFKIHPYPGSWLRPGIAGSLPEQEWISGWKIPLFLSLSNSR